MTFWGGIQRVLIKGQEERVWVLIIKLLQIDLGSFILFLSFEFVPDLITKRAAPFKFLFPPFYTSKPKEKGDGDTKQGQVQKDLIGQKV